MTTVRRLIALATIAAVGILLAACSGGGPQGDLLERAFKKDIQKTNLDFALHFVDNGYPNHITVKGPYIDHGATRLPSFDFDVSYQLEQYTFNGEVISTGQNMWVKYGGETYEVGEDVVTRITSGLKEDAKRHPHSLKSLGLDPARLLQAISWKPDEQVAGADSKHVHARVNVAETLRLLGRLSKAQGERGFSKRDIAEGKKLINPPAIDVWVDKASERVRKIAARLGIRDTSKQVPPTYKVAITAVFKDLDGDPEIKPLQGGRPLRELFQHLGLNVPAAPHAPAGSESPATPA